MNPYGHLVQALTELKEGNYAKLEIELVISEGDSPARGPG